MYLLLLIVTIFACILLSLIVLIQNPKGGGLASNFSGESQLLSVQKTRDVLERGTWILAITIMVLSLVINVLVKDGASKSQNRQLQEKIDKASKPSVAAPFKVPAKPSVPMTDTEKIGKS